MASSIIKSNDSFEKLKADRELQKSLKLLEDNNQITTTASERITKIVKSLKTFARLDEADYQNVNIHEGCPINGQLISWRMGRPNFLLPSNAQCNKCWVSFLFGSEVNSERFQKVFFNSLTIGCVTCCNFMCRKLWRK